MDTEKWPVIHRENGFSRPPWGYKRDVNDPCILNPVPELLSVLEEAFKHLDNGASLRESTGWLAQQLPDNKLSVQGLSTLWKKHRGEEKTPRSIALEERAKQREPKTKEQAKKQVLGKKRQIAKTAITRNVKKLEKIVREENSITKAEDYESNAVFEVDISDVDPEQQVVFKPNPGPQTEFLMASEKEVLYGGAAGGGKSYALLADAARYFDNPNFSGLLLRRTNMELTELKFKSRELYTPFKGKFKEQDSTWYFPSGARLLMSYLEQDKDVLRYQGQSYTWIGVDELTHYATPFAWNYLRSRNRATKGANIDCVMRATTNPGGVGHGWVKKMFVDPAPFGKSFNATDIETGEVMVWEADVDIDPELVGTPLFKRKFIPARVTDNPHLGKDYRATLASMPEHLKRQLLYGDWDVSAGAAFPEWSRKHHVVEPFKIDPSWKRFRSCDYGYASKSAVHWWAIDPSFDTLYCYRELITSKVTGEELADTILRIERDSKDHVPYGVLDSSVWNNTGHYGPSVAEVMNIKGCKWRKADKGNGSRAAGRIRLHELLKVTDYGDRELPGIRFFDTCTNIIANLPIIPTDPDGGEDIDDRYNDDHSYDSVRYAIMSRPRSRSIFDDWFGDGEAPASGYKPANPAFGY